MSTETTTLTVGDTFRITVRDQRPLFKITRIEDRHIIAVGQPDPATHAPRQRRSAYDGTLMNFLIEEVTEELATEAEAQAFFERNMGRDEEQYGIEPEKWDNLTETSKAIYRLAVERGEHLVKSDAS